MEVWALVQAFQRNYERCFAFNAVKEGQRLERTDSTDRTWPIA